MSFYSGMRVYQKCHIFINLAIRAPLFGNFSKNNIINIKSFLIQYLWVRCTAWPKENNILVCLLIS